MPADLSNLSPWHLPAALADLHRSTPAGATVEILCPTAIGDRIDDVVEGAGFRRDQPTGAAGASADRVRLGLERLRTLPDTVGSDMRLLICGLNPSLYAADEGVGFGRPGNRFWPAALAVGLVRTDRDPAGALEHDRVGMTDLVKRATKAAKELTSDEYHNGMARVDRLVAWLQPGAVCFVGLAGWRAARDRGAAAGPQDEPLGGRPVYVMPSTSGLNAHARPADFEHHLRAAVDLAT